MNPKPEQGGDRPQQNPQGGQQQQQQSGEGQQYGEGNYKATRDYNKGMKDHVEHHDIEQEARDAAPRTAAEEKEMEEAERIGRSRAKGGKQGADGQDDDTGMTR
jgi:hypothetical protein